jgi:hypothetical protein
VGPGVSFCPSNLTAPNESHRTHRPLNEFVIPTNDRAKMPEALGHDVSHESAHMPAIKPEQSIKPQQPEIAPVIERGFGMGHSL